MNRRSADSATSLLILGLSSMGLATFLRLVGIGRSLGHDEVYTRVMFASRPIGDILTSYHLPNNHILHTLCVRVAAALFGESEWALRLPALLAGLLVLPVLFGFAHRLTRDPGVAAWSTLLLTISSVHVSFSQQARGYTLLVLLCLSYAWALLTAVEQHGTREPPDREWLPWTLSALAGGLAVLVLPSGALLVGAGALAATALIRLDLPPGRRLRTQGNLLLTTLAVAGIAAAIYLPLLDDVNAHAERFGTPLSVSTWPAFVADVWTRVGPHRWSAGLGLVTLGGAAWLVSEQRARGLFLAGLTALPLVFSLALATGGQPRVYAFLLPFLCIALGLVCARAQERIAERLPDRGWTQAFAVAAVLAPVTVGFGAWPDRNASETGYRDTGRYVAEHTTPGDVVVVPYIVDSAIGYYSGGATVQRVREAVAGSVQRLLFVTRPGTPRFDLPDLMLATNFTTAGADHADTYRHWQLPENAFRRVERFDQTDVLVPNEAVRTVDVGDLLRPDSWRVYFQAGPKAVGWFPVDHPAHRRRGALQVRVDAGQAAVLHSVNVFSPAADGLALLAYCKQGPGYASLYERDGADTRALQMATAISASATVPAGDDTLYTELYLCPVRAGAEYGVFVTAPASDDLLLCDWALYTVPFTPTQVR